MIKILWVDDKLELVNTLKKTISVLKAEITIAKDGIEAFEQIKHVKYDLIILDLLMPPGEWGGLWLLEKINEIKLSLPIIILSGEGTQTETIKALRLGASDYVTKENIESELIDRINMTLNKFAEKQDVLTIISKGENERIEFKSTLRINLHTNKNDKNIENAILKSLSAFLNTEGGTLLIGVSDDGEILGIEKDKFQNKDKMIRHSISLVKDYLGVQPTKLLKFTFEKYQGKEILRIECQKSFTPTYLKIDNKEYFYIRTGPESTNLPISEIHSYINRHFSE